MWMVFVANRWVSVGTPDLGEVSRVFACDARSRSMSWELPDPPRDEDIPHDPPVTSNEHHCIVLTHEWWMCEDCGASFRRDESLGDFPEEAIIENGEVCVAYIPELTA